MEAARRTTLAALLAALALVAFATATVYITNITEWYVKAQGSPLVKVAGADDATNYVNVTWAISGDGTNRTVITVVGFKGDPTTYTDVLRVCNYNYTSALSVNLVYRQVLSGDWSYVKYVKIRYPGDNPSQILYIDSTTGAGTSIPIGSISPGSCSQPIGVEVLVTPNAPTNTALVTIEVDVVASG